MAHDSVYSLTQEELARKFDSPASQDVLQSCDKVQIKTDWKHPRFVKREQGFKYISQTNELIAEEWFLPRPDGDLERYIARLNLGDSFNRPRLVIPPVTE